MDFGNGMVGLNCGPDTVLYCNATGRVLVLNATAAFICRTLAHGTPLDDICRELAATTRADEREIQRDVRRFERAWRELASQRRAAEAHVAAPAAAPAVDVDISATPYRTRYRLADLRFELRSTELADHRAAESVLRHLRDSHEGDADAVLGLVRRAERRLLIHDGAAIDECENEPAVGPMVHAATLMLAYANTARFAALHAGAVLHNGQCILLPAVSGNGKSTLTAALSTAGYEYLTDDFAILTPPPIRVRAVRLGIGLKEGSWPVLADRIPALAELPIHVRTDGKRIRYLPMPRGALRDEPVPVRALVFSEYRPSALETTCRAIRPADALLRLATAGYDARLCEETVRAFVEWLSNVPSYELRYGDVDSAIAAIDEVAR
jgi:hypothetical protein